MSWGDVLDDNECEKQTLKYLRYIDADLERVSSLLEWLRFWCIVILVVLVIMGAVSVNVPNDTNKLEEVRVAILDAVKEKIDKQQETIDKQQEDILRYERELTLLRDLVTSKGVGQVGQFGSDK